MSAGKNLILSYGGIIAALVLAYAVPWGLLGALPLVLFAAYLNRRAIPRRPRPPPLDLALLLCSVAVFLCAVLLHLLWLQIVTLIFQLMWGIWYEFRARKSRHEHGV